IDQVIGALTLEELATKLDSTGVIWAPMQTLPEAMSDPQVRANGYITTLDHPVHGPFETLQTPLKFSDSDVRARTAAPELGQHTEEVLLEIGYSWDDIEDLRQDGAIT
ncbi:MAG: CoA transferase, partial [Chloroflexi bacterium]|nr:CoA transferase [Chloroflexota bacterium]